MRQLVLMLIIALGCQTLTAQEVSPADSVAIANKIDDWNKAWKTKNVDLACQWYTEEADFTNAFGFSQIGRIEIHEYLTRVFAFDFVMAGSTQQTSVKLKKICDNAILAITTVERTGQRSADGKDLGTRRTSHYRFFEKTSDWFITAHLISDARSIDTEKH